MGDLTKYLPENSPIVEAIFEHYKTEGDKEEVRGYLGASIIGHACKRYLWYTFRGCTKEDFPGRLYRLFETGDLEEIRQVKDLRAIGCTVHEVDPTTGDQFEVTAIGGHLSGHMDGCLINLPGVEKTWHVYEGKTHNQKSYRKLQKEGVQKSKPIHYAQMQIYMHLTGMTRALYLAVNKDTDEMYAERVHYDRAFCDAIMAKARGIIFAKEPPPRITDRPDWYECKFCSAHSLCWGCGEAALPIPSVTCRSCCHASPTEDGHARWVCEKHDRGLAPKDQKAACDDHLVLPGLISFAEPDGYRKDLEGNESIVFVNKDGGSWCHGTTAGHFSTRELLVISASALVSPMLSEAKELFGTEVNHCFTDDILSRYPESDTELVYRGETDGLKAAWKKRYNCEMLTCGVVKKVDTGDYRAIEFTAGRVAVIRYDRRLHPAEIWEGKE